MRKGRKRWYAGVLDIPEGTSGPISIQHRHEPAGATMQSGNVRTAMFGQQSEALTFADPTCWHTLFEEGQGVWMTDLPIEQRQHDDIIATARGRRVLVGGLGLGYAVVALSQRPTVKEIVVVERSADIINLVWDATLAKVPEALRPKVTVVHADLFDYLKARESFFTWGFFDIWQADGETTFHETVVPLRRLADGMVRTVTCWNEDIMRAQLFMGIQTRVTLLTHHLADGMVSLDQLCTDSEVPYVQWAVPFWRWFRDNQAHITPEILNETMRRYVRSYGRPELVDGLWGLPDLTPAHGAA